MSGFLQGRKKLLFLIPGVFVFSGVFGFFIDSMALKSGMKVWEYFRETPLAVFGFYLFFSGFSVMRKKRLVDDIPTSKIRSAAMGLAEVCGLAREKFPLVSALETVPCVYYRFLVEKEKRNSKGGTYWAKVREGSSSTYFYVEDATGKILVDPLNAETVLVKDFERIDGSGLLGGRTRYSEWNLKSGDYVYILGTVQKHRDMMEERKDRLIEKLRLLKQDAERMKTFDADGDGQISPEEWDRARSAAEQELLEEELRRPPDEGDDIVIARGEGEKTFIISDRDEHDVGKRLGLKAAGSIVLGGTLILGAAAAVLWRANVIGNVF